MCLSKRIRNLSRFLEPYHLRIEADDHCRIINAAGRAIYWFPSTPSDGNFSKQIIRDLVRMNILPKEAKKTYRAS